jgi:hypothetical protein
MQCIYKYPGISTCIAKKKLSVKATRPKKRPRISWKKVGTTFYSEYFAWFYLPNYVSLVYIWKHVSEIQIKNSILFLFGFPRFFRFWVDNLSKNFFCLDFRDFCLFGFPGFLFGFLGMVLFYRAVFNEVILFRTFIGLKSFFFPNSFLVVIFLTFFMIMEILRIINMK